MGLTPSFSGNALNPQAPPGATRNSSFAFYRWTPPNDGAFTFQAVYSGDTSAQASTSAVDTVLATPTTLERTSNDDALAYNPHWRLMA